MENIQEKLITGLREGDKKVFNGIFNAYYAPLCRYCTRIVYDVVIAEEIVQDLFCKLWIKRDELEIETSLKAYLYRAVLNHSLNYLNHRKTEEKYRQYVGFQIQGNLANPGELLEEQDVQRILSLAILQMPEKRRLIFEMSRQEEMKYSEIAEKLNISVKTVESQISKALEYLRKIFSEILGLILPLAITCGTIGNELLASGM
ncbi:MAG: RNA polymerase sigma-70 factor [Bacteroidales bacterium]|nr:RNA polymerase sigma-70 factor [Bacteroidales bacterium]